MALENPIGAGQLVVTFHRAQDLRKVEFLGQSPAVHFRLNNNGDVQKSPPHHHANHTPVWNFPYAWDLSGNEHTLNLEVVHQGMIGTTFIGKADIPLQNVILPGENWFRLSHGDHGDSAGDICLSSQWTPSHPAQAPQPVFVAPPQPVYVAPPQPVYVAPPQPVYVAPPQQSIAQEVAALVQELATIERISSGQVHRIALRGSNGRFLHAGEHHKAHFSGAEVNHLSTWHVIHHEGRVVLRSAHGKFLAAYGDGRVAADRDEHSHNERFLIEELGGGNVALRTHHGTYLGADGEGPIVQRGELGPHERFFLQVID